MWCNYNWFIFYDKRKQNRGLFKNHRSYCKESRPALTFCHPWCVDLLNCPVKIVLFLRCQMQMSFQHEALNRKSCQAVCSVTLCISFYTVLCMDCKPLSWGLLNPTAATVAQFRSTQEILCCIVFLSIFKRI
jgi:hypothetical protein